MVEFLSDSAHLVTLELADLDGLPALGGADHRADRELEHQLLAEGVGDDLAPPAFRDEQVLKQIRNPDRAALRDRNAQVCDAGLEVILEASGRAGQLDLLVGDHSSG